MFVPLDQLMSTLMGRSVAFQFQHDHSVGINQTLQPEQPAATAAAEQFGQYNSLRQFLSVAGGQHFA